MVVYILGSGNVTTDFRVVRGYPGRTSFRAIYAKAFSQITVYHRVKSLNRLTK
jgi:hypothetical protein